MPTSRHGRTTRSPRLLASCGMVVFLALAAISGTASGQQLSILHNFAGSATNEGSYPNSSLAQDNNGNFYGTTSGGGTFGQSIYDEGTIFKMAPDGTVSTLHSFGTASRNLDGSTIADGYKPSGNLVFATDGNLYGTTAAGGEGADGTVYRISPAGVYTIVHSFAAANADQGTYPEAGVIEGKDGNFYGTTSQGGAYGVGTVFQLKPDGTYKAIYSFGATTDDPASPSLGLVQDAQGNLYGTSAKGGSAGLGAIYKIDSQFNYSVIYSFMPAPAAYTFTFNSSYATNVSGGFSPNSPLVIGADGALYGTASGTTYGAGAIYKVTPQGQFTLLHRFGDGSVASDGAEYPINTSTSLGISQGVSSLTAPPAGPMVLATDGNFYGTTYQGGLGNGGTVFEMTPAGQVTIVHRFGDGAVAVDGVNPNGLTQGSDGNFYGTTSAGGTATDGTAFKITADLPVFTSLLHVSAAVGVPFTYQMVAAQGPVTYSVGSLPSGFNFDGTSVISGTPTAAGTLVISITATNANGSDTVPLVITVYAPPVITSLLNVVGSTTGLSYQILATLSPTQFAATGLPPGVWLDPVNGTFNGVPTQAGTYQVTISATNPAGTTTAALTLNILSSPPTPAQEYMLIHSFGDGSVSGEGSFPAGMTLGTDSTFYGVTAQGGVNGGGTVFNLSPAGNARVIANLGGANGSTPQGIIQTVDGTLYGTTQTGGSANEGTIFKITPDGVLTLLHTFGDLTVANDGANPQCGLILASDGNFYGTTQYGGAANQGTVYQMTPAGVVTILHSFGNGMVAGFGTIVSGGVSSTPQVTDGAQPVAALMPSSGVALSGGGITLFGTTMLGGAQNVGTVFAISSNGSVEILHSFGDPTVATGDGQLPHASVTVPPGNINQIIYGTTMAGGSIGKGTVFALNTMGLGGVTILHNFGDGSVTNDGENPNSPLTAVQYTSGELTLEGVYTLYGTTQNGGTANQGTVFSCYTYSGSPGATNSTTTILHNFGDSSVPNDGTISLGGLGVGADGNLYGTTVGGGVGSGTAFVIQLNQPTGTAILTPWTYSGNIPPGMTFDPNSGTVSGTPLLTDSLGRYSFTITQYSSGSVVGTPQTVTINLAETLAAWASSHGLNVSCLGDAGSDCVSNLLKALCDIDPQAPMTAANFAALPTVGFDTTTTPGTNYFVLTYRYNPGILGLTVTLQASSDLQNWTTVSSPDIYKQIGTDTSTAADDPIMEIGVVANGTNRFLRLNVSTP